MIWIYRVSQWIYWMGAGALGVLAEQHGFWVLPIIATVWLVAGALILVALNERIQTNHLISIFQAALDNAKEDDSVRRT